MENKQRKYWRNFSSDVAENVSQDASIVYATDKPIGISDDDTWNKVGLQLYFILKRTTFSAQLEIRQMKMIIG